MTDVVTLLLLGLFTAAAAVTDYKSGHIPNRLVAAGAAGGIALGLGVAFVRARAAGQSGATALSLAAAAALVGLVLCAAVPVVLYRASAMGGGDVKLLAAVGAVAGPMLGLEIQLTAFVVAALYAGCVLAYRGRLLRLLANTLALATNPLRDEQSRKEVPGELLTSLRFAPAVFAATLLSTAAHWRLP